ncbi:MAG TPA: hypothetical protein ENK55_08910 [Actinobacteria bacterium]|nr:hypothetical protein [Actinomycetota bacterium]
MREFTVTLANRPGQLAQLAKLLADHGVHLESLAAVALDGESIVRFLPQEPGLARRALDEAGLHYEEHPVLDTFVHGNTDALVELTEQLARAGVNIESMYLLHTNAEGRHFALIVDDTEAARSTLGT